MDYDIEFSAQAFSKMIMHAIKYPHSVCSGLLLAPKSITDEDGDNVVKIVDAIPVSHASHCLAPNIEIAFNSVSNFAREQELVVFGYYQTDRHNEATGPDAFSQRVTEKICESQPKAVLCFINFELPSLIDPHQYVDGRWKRRPSNTFKVENDPEVITENIIYTKERLYRKIVDFDEHFNNISLDWTNARVAQRIDNLIAEIC